VTRVLRSSDRIPDGIEPLVGFRAWTYAFEGTSAALYPVATMVPDGPTPWAGAESRWVVASCPNADLGLLDGSHQGLTRTSHGEVPDERCTCGFYSMKTLYGLLQQVQIPREVGGTEGGILGRVELAGKIIEHDLGYRAERARIAQLIPFEADLANGIRLAEILGVDLGDPVRPWPHPTPDGAPPSPPDGASSLRLRVGDWVQDVAA
jgi:hypothetical protein